MKCPHCNKEIIWKDKGDYNRKMIIELLKKTNKLNIVQISKNLQINRSTLRYYLNELKSDNKIKIKRELNQPGRPTYIVYNKVDEE